MENKDEELSFDKFPLEIYDLIASISTEAYRALLVVKRFAKSLTIDKRINLIIFLGYSVKITKDSIEWRFNDEFHTLWDNAPCVRYTNYHDICYEWYNKGKLHRKGNFPSSITINKYSRRISELWTNADGKLHSIDDKPATIRIQFSKKGTEKKWVEKIWYDNGINHRENDQPAIYEKSSLFCKKRWVNKGKLHRPPQENGNHKPAYIFQQFLPFDNGMTIIPPHTEKMWFVNQKKLKKEYYDQHNHIITHYDSPDYRKRKIWKDDLGNVIKEKRWTSI